MKAVRFGSLFALLVVVLVPVLVFAQTTAVTDESGNVIKIHRFQPVMPAESAEAVASAAATRAGALSDYVARQIDAMEQDKQARTTVQMKISSNLIYAERMLQHQPAAPGIPIIRSGIEVDDLNNMLVDIRADITEDFLKILRSEGARIVQIDSTHHYVQAFVAPAHLQTVAAHPEVTFVSPRRQAMTRRAAVTEQWATSLNAVRFAQRIATVRQNLSTLLATQGVAPICSGQGSAVSEGLKTHQADAACTTFGVTGTGVKIGVLSDGIDSLAISQGTGNIPPSCPAGPPCMTVLPGQAGGGDEGTAMLEIVHDLAPGADLYFATAFTSPESFAQNILNLRAAGCDIIVDDVFWFNETPFQDGQAPNVVSNQNAGIIAQSVNEVTADGALYFSAAGNEGNKDDAVSQTYEGDFVDGGSNSLISGGKVNKFGTTAYDSVTATFQSGGTLLLYWADPIGGSANDYDLYVLNSGGTSIVAASTDPQTGTQDPEEGEFGNVDCFPSERVVVFKATSAANRFFHLGGLGARFQVSTSGAIFGHAGATGALGVAATPALAAYPNPFSGTDVIETFSSDGPRRIFFHADGSAITPGNFSSSGGVVLQKPDITAADGVTISNAGGWPDPAHCPGGGPNFCAFFGTSAAAPHAAAIAALIKSSDLNLTNTEISNLMTSTAIDIMGTGVDRDSGAGIVMALAAVQASIVPKVTGLSPNHGGVGTSVTIAGIRFGGTQGGSTVTFNGTPVTSVSNWSDTSLTVSVPTGATNGPVVVTVNSIASTSSNNSNLFTFDPAISGLSTGAAPAGTSITITGTNFGSTQDTAVVTINGKTASVTSRTGTTIAANVPSGASTSGNVVVAVNGVASNGMPFIVEDFANPASLGDITVKAGASGSDPFTITTTTGFDATITFSCTGLPSKSTCSFNPASVSSVATSADVTMTVSTTAPITNGVASGLFGIWLPFGGLGLVLAAGAGARKRNRKALAALGVLVLLPLLAAIVSCGGGGSSHTTTPGTPPGSYTVTMKATATGGTTHSTTFKLNVN